MGEPLIFDFYLLIPFYNNLAGLLKSLETVRYEPARFGVVIVDDGSQIPLQYEDLINTIPKGLSLTIVRLHENKGITQALNTGLQWLATAAPPHRFVARLDCADLCAPERFTQQVRFLQDNSEIDLVGTWCVFSNHKTGESYRYNTPTDHKKIVRGMHFRNIFIHPTVMWRSDIAARIGTYPENYPHAEDYGFFYEIINKGHAAVIPLHLVTCEINPKGLSLNYRKEQLKSRIRVVKQYGKSKIFSVIGIVKLRILLIMPYKLVLTVKKIAYGI